MATTFAEPQSAPRSARRRTEFLLLAVIVAAWAVSIWVEVSGTADRLHHDELYGAVTQRAVSMWGAVFLVATAWLVMTAAMMLPSSLPMARLYLAAAQQAPRWRPAFALFLLGYFAVWVAFAVPAFLGDIAIHALARSWSWLGENERVIPAATLGVAAVWQLTPLKDACLRACRHPVSFLLRYYRRGLGGGWHLGVRHGLFCLGCCWALMLVMFAAGVAHLAWMGILGLIMLAEKTLPGGDRLPRLVGGALGVAAVAVLVMPSTPPGTG